jgi:hypothetical protein
MSFSFNSKQRAGILRLLFFSALLLMVGCRDQISDEKRRIAKYQATLKPENGRIVEVNGEEFRIVYIGGVRFRFPNTNQFHWNGADANSPSSDGISIHLLWPDIPPGKSLQTKFVAMEGEIGRTNSIEAQVRGASEPVLIDKSKTIEELWRLNANNYFFHDDPKSGLRIFNAKETPNFPAYLYSLKNDANDPVSGLPVVVSDGQFIHFMFAPQVSVRIIMMGGIHPDWKGIYLGVIETLNKYREDK